MSINNGGLLFSKIYMYCLVFFVILCSGSAFMLTYGGTLSLAVLLVFLFYLIWNNDFKLKYKNVYILLFMVSVYIINMVIYSNENINRNQYFFNIIALCIAFLFSQLLSYKEFKVIFIEVMVAIAIFSLIMHFSALWFGIDKYAVSYGKHKLLLLHNYHALRGDTFARNSGMFWEPGAYQIFLNIALIFELTNQKKYKIFRLIVLIGTVITTGSTTGYIVLAIISLYMLLDFIRKTKDWRFTVLATVVVIIIAPIIFYLFFNSAVVQDKLFNEHASTNMRTTDLIGSINVIKEMPIWGLGVNTSYRAAMYHAQGMVTNVNSVGIFASTINYGILYMLVYITLIIITLVKDRGNHSLLFLICLVMFVTTEAIFEFPIMYLLMFDFKSKPCLFKEKPHGVCFKMLRCFKMIFTCLMED